jgi:hypothetical protein
MLAYLVGISLCLLLSSPFLILLGKWDDRNRKRYRGKKRFVRAMGIAIANVGERKLAHIHQVSPTTIARWASGKVTPHERIQKLIIGQYLGTE